MTRLRIIRSQESADGDIQDYWQGNPDINFGPQAVSTVRNLGVCEDDTGRHKVNPLSITKRSSSIIRLVGKADFSEHGFSYFRLFRGRVPTLYVSHATSHLSTSLPSEGSSLATLLARTNPGRSDFNAPAAIGEMRDIPRLVQQIGSIINRIRSGSRRPPTAQQAGGWYLGYQFGIAPLISDARKLIHFASTVEKRLAELRRLNERGGLSRKRTLGSGVESVDYGNVSINSLGGFWSAKHTKNTKWKRWASVKWTLNAPIPELAGDARQQLAYARRISGGWNAAGLTEAAWQLMPWSWLTDWFTNADDLLKAHNGSVPASPTRACVMTQIGTTENFSSAAPEDARFRAVQGGSATFTYETKERYIGAPSLNTSVPVFNGRQMSILGALAIQRYRG